MALPINISDLINRRVIESARIEYKGAWNPEPILHSICAFANDLDNWAAVILLSVSMRRMECRIPCQRTE